MYPYQPPPKPKKFSEEHPFLHFALIIAAVVVLINLSVIPFLLVIGGVFIIPVIIFFIALWLINKK